MAHVETYTINGRKYRYEVTNYRIGKKVRHKKKYLGAVEPINNRGNPNAGRKPAIFVRQITQEELGALETAKRSNDAFTRDRAKILLLSLQNNDSKQIAAKLCCEKRKVRKAIKAFNSRGIEALQRGKTTGATKKFSQDCRKIMLLHFSKAPKDFGLHFTSWSLPRFRQHLMDYKVVDSISIETVRQILDEAGARLKKSKRWQYSPDKDFDKKNKR